MKRVYESIEPSHSHMFAAMLEDNGIEAEVLGEELTSLRAYMPRANVSVWVKDEDWARAKQLAAEFDASRRVPAASGTWQCPKCGEQLSTQFAECWKCQKEEDAAPRPASREFRVRALRIAACIAILILLLLALSMAAHNQPHIWFWRRAPLFDIPPTRAPAKTNKVSISSSDGSITVPVRTDVFRIGP